MIHLSGVDMVDMDGWINWLIYIFIFFFQHSQDSSQMSAHNKMISDIRHVEITKRFTSIDLTTLKRRNIQQNENIQMEANG